MAEPYLEMLSTRITSLNLSGPENVALEYKHFFSGAALYANGKICASLTPAGFGLKLPVETRRKLIENGEGKELRYFKNAPVKREYVALSEAVKDDPEKLKSLLNQSVNYVTRHEQAV